MDSVFPTGFPAATALYLVLYVTTFCLHVLFMSYVLAGSAFVAVAGTAQWLRLQAPRPEATRMIVDWLPFAVGIAITAGVAPLLFVQILYQPHFYTANLLLFYRWLAIIPVLIAGFYLAYLLKSGWLARRRQALRFFVAFGALACFAFTGYSWTENHVLSTREPAWASFYGSGAHFYSEPSLLWRFLQSFAGAFPSLAVILGWQLRRAGDVAPLARTVSILGLGGLVAGGGAAGAHYATLPDAARALYSGPMAGPYLWLALGGVALQGVAWLWTWRSRTLRARAVWLASAGLAATLIGMAVVREALRLGSIDLPKLLGAHVDALTVGGVGAFIASFAVAALLIVWCIQTVRKKVSI